MTETLLWAAVQGVGTLIAALAALAALVIAGSQLRQLIASNRLLAESNDTMAESNIALTRPYVVIDFEFLPSITRAGGTSGTSVFVVVRNDGRTPAHEITMLVGRPFTPVSEPDQEGWRKSVDDLNRMMDGETVLRSLTSTRPLKYYLDDETIFGVADESAPSWTVDVAYSDGQSRRFRESFELDVEPWRRSLATADPLLRVGKHIDAVAHELLAVNRTLRDRQTQVRLESRISVARGASRRSRRRVERLRDPRR